jgi:hypothetical protein
VTQTYNNVIPPLSEVFKMLETSLQTSSDYRISGVSITIDNVNRQLQTGFAVGANMQAAMVVLKSILFAENLGRSAVYGHSELQCPFCSESVYRRTGLASELRRSYGFSVVSRRNRGVIHSS